MASGHTLKTYYFNMRYKPLLPDQEEWGSGFHYQLDSLDLVININEWLQRKSQ